MKNYQNNTNLFITNFLILLTSIIILVYISLYQIATYQNVTASIVLDNVYSVMLDNKSLRHIQKNKYVYVKNKKKKIEIVSLTRNYYKNYHQVLIRLKEEKEQINISIYDKSKSFIKLFLECWEEDKWKN